MGISIANDSKRAPAADAVARVLLLDTPENQGVDFLKSLKQRGMAFTEQRVGSRDELFSTLQADAWDILLVNDLVSRPTTEETLAHLRQIRSDTGLVVLSSKGISVDSLTEAYRQGVSDLVSDQHPDYSCEVFSRAVERSRRNFQLSQLNQEKFELTRHRDQLMSGTEEALAYLQDGIHVFGNDAYLAMLGYAAMDDLAVMPFIDVVSTEMRDKVKQQLLDYQHKARLKPDTEALEIDELFVAATGEKAGILQVSAEIKAVTYDGDECLQIVLRDKTAAAGRESAHAQDGLGYPLFLSHLDNFLAEARASGGQTGQVIHIQGNGFEHYLAGRGFGSLNGKMKALASELKAMLGDNDFMIRFTENSFLVLLKAVAAEDARILGLEVLLERFESALNREIGLDGNGPAITLAHEQVAVDAGSESAEQLIRTFLLAGTAERPASAAADKRTAADKSAAADRKAPAEPGAAAEKAVAPESTAGADASAPAAGKVVPFAKKGRDKAEAVKEETATVDDAAPRQAAPKKAAQKKTPHQQAHAPAATVSAEEVSAALTANRLQLLYEPMISVAEIETEYYCLGTWREGKDLLSRERLGAALCSDALAGKLDQWSLGNALDVVGELYKQGQEYRVLLPFTARSLAEKHLPGNVREALAAHSMPPGMLTMDFSLQDVAADIEAAARQLAGLAEAGARLCISGVSDAAQLDGLLQHTAVHVVRLDGALLADAARDAGANGRLGAVIDALHGHRIKVAASGIDSGDMLNLCCRARLDLVNGAHIQKQPLPLSADTLTQAMAL